MTLSDMRKHLKITQRQLASIIKIDRSTVSKWENNKLLPNTKNLMKLAECFCYSESDILNAICQDKK